MTTPPAPRTTVSSPSRQIAARVLERVAEGGAWASPVLDAELRRAKLDERNAGLATEIVYGTLRALPSLDVMLDALLPRGIASLDGMTRAALRTASYQLLHLGRVPPHATVSDTVTIVRAWRGEKLAGLANAVLRKVAAHRPAAPAPPTSQAVPVWLRDELVLSVGEARASAFLASRPLPPSLALRVEDPGKRSEVVDHLRRTTTIEAARSGALAPGAILLRGAGDPRKLDVVVRGEATVQEEGAQVIACLLGARAGDRVADVCAGHGGKTLALMRAVGASGHVTAIDLYEEKLSQIADEVRRVHGDAKRLTTLAVDLTAGTGGLEARFDRVLVDAPCTGLGTIHRRPEILLRVGPTDPDRLAELQWRILQRAVKLARKGATLVYAVCSLARAEGEGIVRRAVDAGVVALDDAPPALSTIERDPDGLIRLGPWSAPQGEGCDGYVVAVLRRT